MPSFPPPIPTRHAGACASLIVIAAGPPDCATSFPSRAGHRAEPETQAGLYQPLRAGRPGFPFVRYGPLHPVWSWSRRPAQQDLLPAVIESPCRRPCRDGRLRPGYVLAALPATPFAQADPTRKHFHHLRCGALLRLGRCFARRPADAAGPAWASGRYRGAAGLLHQHRSRCHDAAFTISIRPPAPAWRVARSGPGCAGPASPWSSITWVPVRLAEDVARQCAGPSRSRCSRWPPHRNWTLLTDAPGTRRKR